MKSLKHLGKLLVPMALAFTSGNALATATLVLTDGFTVKKIVDNVVGGGDVNPGVGEIAHFGSVGIFSFTVDSGFSKDFFGKAHQPGLKFDSNQTTKAITGPGTFDAWLVDDLFTKDPLSGALTMSNFDSSVSASDPGPNETNDYELCYMAGGGLLAAIEASPTSDCFTLGGTPLATDTLLNGELDVKKSVSGFSTTNPYSLALHVKVKQAAVGNSTFEAKFVPEPSSIAAWGLGLVGLTIARRRKSKA